ncbi:hypothetical protein GCM10010415_67050 [Streptomyces atrovirens]
MWSIVEPGVVLVRDVRGRANNATNGRSWWWDPLGPTGIPYRFIGGLRDACSPWFSSLNSASELVLFWQWKWRAFDSHSITIRSDGWWDPSPGCSARNSG